MVPSMLLVINIGIWIAVWQTQYGRARIVFLNIGQGDAIYIEAPNGNQMLIDGGRDQTVLKELRAVMPWWDRSINVVLGTHPDADHVGGLSFVLDRYKADVFVESGNSADTGAYNSLKTSVVAHHVPDVEARTGEVIWLDTDMYFVVLFPDTDPRGMESNTASIVGKLVYGKSEVMLTGDAPVAIEAYLVSRYGNALQSSILKAGHHGSRTSTSDVFLHAVSPEEVVISAGIDNQYGHPHKEVVTRITDFGSVIRNTSKDGRIEYVLASDGSFMERQH